MHENVKRNPQRTVWDVMKKKDKKGFNSNCKNKK